MLSLYLHSLRPDAPGLSAARIGPRFAHFHKAGYIQDVKETMRIYAPAIEKAKDIAKKYMGSPSGEYSRLARMFDPKRFPLPTAATCFNTLRLPEYPSEAILQHRVATALRHGVEGFGFE